MASVADKIRRSREFEREINGWKLRLRRPTDWEAQKLFNQDQADALEVATGFVIGWKGVKESDIVNAGGSDEVAFDEDLWSEVIADRPELWRPISQAIVEAWVKHSEQREGRAKN